MLDWPVEKRWDFLFDECSPRIQRFPLFDQSYHVWMISIQTMLIECQQQNKWPIKWFCSQLMSGLMGSKTEEKKCKLLVNWKVNKQSRETEQGWAADNEDSVVGV